MSVYRIQKYNDVTLMDNGFIRSTTLSLDAKGLMAQILSYPDDWRFSIRDLEENCKDSIASIHTAILELEKAGYLVRRPDCDSSRFDSPCYDIYELPRTAMIEPGCITPEGKLHAHDTISEFYTG